MTTAHTGILNGQASMPDYQKAWYLQAASPMLERSTFMPNHPDFGRYNGILFKALQGVETGRLTPVMMRNVFERARELIEIGARPAPPKSWANGPA